MRPFPRLDTAPYDRFSPQPFVTAQRMDVLLPAARRGRAGADRRRALDGARAARAGAGGGARARAARRARRAPRARRARRGARARGLRAPAARRGARRVRACAAASSTSSRPSARGRCGSSCSATRSSRSASSIPRASAPRRRCARVVAPPARELLFDRDLVVERVPALRALAEAQGVAGPRDRPLDRHAAARRGAAGLRGPAAAAPARAREPVFDFLPEDALVVVEEWEAGRERLLRYAGEALENHEAARAAGRPVLAARRVLPARRGDRGGAVAAAPVLLDGARRRRGPGPRARGRALRRARVRPGRAGPRAAPRARRRRGPRASRRRRSLAWRAEGLRVVLAAPSLSGADRLARLLAERGVAAALARQPEPFARWAPEGGVEVRVAPLSAGFVLPAERLAVVTEEEVFGPRERRRRAASLREGAAIEALAHLAPGDLPGARRARDRHLPRPRAPRDRAASRASSCASSTRRATGSSCRCDRLNLVQRYVGAEGARRASTSSAARPGRRRRARVRKAIQALARELLAVYAEREVAPGHAFSPPRRCASASSRRAFPYEETPGPGRARSRTCSPTWQRRGRWTGWSAATSATARPRSRCAPPSAW